jgi:hypothetical protein
MKWLLYDSWYIETTDTDSAVIRRVEARVGIKVVTRNQHTTARLYIATFGREGDEGGLIAGLAA